MKITMTKYCIMTEDLKEVMVGLSQRYHFIPIDSLEKSKTKINLYNSYNVAKSSFQSSFGCHWDETNKVFSYPNPNYSKRYVIRKVVITYDVEMEAPNEELN